MNEFGVPMGDAEMNMLKNPAKAAMQANITAGTAVNWWQLPLAIIGIGAQVYGANKAASAAEDQAQNQNEATE